MINQKCFLRLLIGVTMLLYSCRHDPNSLYHFYVDKAGETIREGDFVALTFVEKTEEDSITYNSLDEDGRWIYKFREPSAFNGDFFTAMGTLSEGDSAMFKISLDSLRANGRSDLALVKGRYLIYHINIKKVIARGNMNDSLFNAAIEKFKNSEIEQARVNEAERIRQFIYSNHLKPEKTKSGLFYIINQPGTGPVATASDTVEINYTAKFLSGKVFETNSRKVAKTAGIFNEFRRYGLVKQNFFPGKPLSGIEEALLMFPVGTRATLVIPSKLAFKGSAYRGLKPYTPLLCDIEIVSVINPK